MPADLLRGEVYWFDFAGSVGSEPDKIRPALVLQTRWVTGLETVLAVPFTKELHRAKQKTGIFVPAEEAGLPNDSVALCHLLTALDRSRVREARPTGRASEQTIQKILCVITELLDISAETFPEAERPA